MTNLDFQIVNAVNELWAPVYPHLARYVADLAPPVAGDALEFGPFAGGIATSLISLRPELHITVSGAQEDVFARLQQDLRTVPGGRRCHVRPSPLSPIDYLDESFDLVIIRGAFFFLTPAMLRDIDRILRPGGRALIGGGYGPYTPSSIIKEIGEESKRLNASLGKPWVSSDHAQGLLRSAGVEAEVTQEGGLWIIMHKPGAYDSGLGTQKLIQAFNLDERGIISIVGAGGKTTLMFALGSALHARGRRVICTTTTKIFEPTEDDTPCVIVDRSAPKLLSALRDALDTHGHITVASERFESGKIGGTASDLIEAMSRDLDVDHILVEADGARRLPIKAPGSDEPVVPPVTRLFVPVVGIDAAGVPLDNTHAFRPADISRLTNVSLGTRLTTAAIARLLVHPGGLLKGAPVDSAIVPVINKVETRGDARGASEIARDVLSQGDGRITRVLLTRVFSHDPFVDVVHRGTMP
jgi:probable selenium-dependent hydroxylase accessory protein YqeC